MARELSNQIGASRALALAALVSIAGCGSDAAPAGSDGGADATLDGAMDAAPFVFPEVPPFAAGAPITAAPLEWTYIPFDETRCMNNTPVGIGINPSATSADVIIVFQGGNLCFDLTSCITVANLSGFDAADLGPTVSYMESGIFSRTDLDNPMRDWNFVFIPYCSGDLHAGNHPASYRNRAYMGFSNTRAFLSRIVPTFADAGRVVVAGSSAGGFGALANYDQTVAAFQSVGSAARIHLLDDAG
ncbi:MAG: pectinacetylesterase family protein, partial [Myxococcales bacterium]|nr:pectinacetylesterase family protein [Myxococcales bacterium]